MITSLILGGSIFLIVLVIAFYIIYVIGLWKLFQKAGKQGWEAIIPFYNTYVLVEISGLNWWYFLIAISGTIFSILKIQGLDYVTEIASLGAKFFIYWNLGKKMKQNHVSIAILGTLFSPIMAMILGLSKNYQYDQTVIVNPNGPINDNTNSNTNTNNTNKENFCPNCGTKINPDTKFCGNCGKKVD